MTRWVSPGRPGRQPGVTPTLAAMTWGQIWGAYLGAVVAVFGVLEGIGLGIHPKGRGQPPNESLSEVTWSWLKVIPGQDVTHWTLPHVLAAVFVVGLILTIGGHLILGLWR